MSDALAVNPPNVRVGVAVLLVRPDDKILVGMRKGSHGAGTWTVPGGHLEFGESIVECAKREVFEETGIDLYRDARQGYLGGLAAVTNDIFPEADKHYITTWVIFHLRENDVEVFNKEPEKCAGWEWHNYHEVPQPHFLGFANLGKIYPTYEHLGVMHVE